MTQTRTWRKCLLCDRDIPARCKYCPSHKPKRKRLTRKQRLAAAAADLRARNARTLRIRDSVRRYWASLPIEVRRKRTEAARSARRSRAGMAEFRDSVAQNATKRPGQG